MHAISSFNYSNPTTNDLNFLGDMNLVLLSIMAFISIDLLLDSSDSLVGELLVLEHCLCVSVHALKSVIE